MHEKAIKKRMEIRKKVISPIDCPNKIPLQFSLGCLFKIKYERCKIRES
jgi:hypothetical protein